MPDNFSEDEPFDVPDNRDNESERDNYDILGDWMVDKQGDHDYTADEIADALRAGDVIDEDGTVDDFAMEKVLDGLGLVYEGFDAETWEDIIVQYEDK